MPSIASGSRAALILFATCGGFSASSSAQLVLEPRMPGAKASLAQLAAMPASDRVVVKFQEGLTIRQRGGALTGLAAGDAAASAALRSAGVSVDDMRRMHARSEAEIDQERLAAEQESGRDLADLNLYFVINLPAGVSAVALANQLNQLPAVEFAEPGPVPAPPPTDIAPPTPNFISNQGYRLPPGQGGVGALNSLNYPGADGTGLDVVDIEYAWRLDHEDLELPANRVLTNGATVGSYSTHHGTAVLGVLVGRRNSYGVTGLAPAARAWVAPATTLEFGYDPARAIGLATKQLQRGEVMVIEQQYWVCGYPQGDDRYGPVEVIQAVFDAISVATAKGIVVAAAAGNGSVNLDGANCNNLFNPAFRDSGAIIVGAGDSDSRFRLLFSSYGSRVDVQGWGENVTTTGYGHAFDGGGDLRQRYTHGFNGTSSATPIVAGAILQIQGVRKACGLPLKGPLQMRANLKAYGTPQLFPETGNIGPLPRIRTTLEATTPESCV